MLEKFERIKFGHFPTPIEHLKNITKYLGGPNIFIKRDDCTGLATGGNKTRNLEFLIADAIKNKAELVVTVGAVQSNHARQTAAACTLMGLKCLIILEQRVKDPPDVYMNSGNVFLDKLFGADVNICPKNENFSQYSEKIIEDFKLEVKVAIQNSENVDVDFEARMGIFSDTNDDAVAFSVTSNVTFDAENRNLESVDVFTSWDDKTRVDNKIKNFEDLWANRTKYVEIYDLVYAEKKNLLKYTTEWAVYT